MNSPLTTPSSRLLMTSKARFLCDGKAGVRVLRHFWQLSSPVHALFAALKPWRGETDHAFLPSIDPSRRNKYRHTTTVQLLTKKRSIVLSFLTRICSRHLARASRSVAGMAREVDLPAAARHSLVVMTLARSAVAGVAARTRPGSCRRRCGNDLFRRPHHLR